jgi:cytochrome c-type biogenesis protein CcmH
MTMSLFLLAVVALIGGTLLMLLRPWRAGGDAHDADAREINARIYRDQLAELDRDRDAGTLAPADHARATDELQRRLLDDTRIEDPARTAAAARAPRTSLLLAVSLPIAAMVLYAWLGTPAAVLAPAMQQVATQGADPHEGFADPTQVQIEAMVARLAARLEKNPDDPKGWAMLAHSYRVLGRHAEAVKAYQHIGKDVLEQDAGLLSGYADSLATLAGGNIEGPPLQLVMAALKVDPDHPMSLSLAGTAAYRRGDYPEAARYWKRLLKVLPPDSPDAQFLIKTLADIGQPVTPDTPGAPGAPG